MERPINEIFLNYSVSNRSLRLGKACPVQNYSATAVFAGICGVVALGDAV